MTRRHTGGGSDGGSSHTDGGGSDHTQRPAGTGGDKVEFDADHIDTMAGKLDDTAGKVDTLDTTLDRTAIGPQSYGVLGGAFAGTAQQHKEHAKQQVQRTKDAVAQAQQGTKTTAKQYRETEAANADTYRKIDDDTDIPVVRSDSTSPASTTTPASTDKVDPPPQTGQPGGSDKTPSIGDRLDGNDDGGGGPPKDPNKPGGSDEPERQPDRNPPPLSSGSQSLGRFSEDRLTREPAPSNRITHIDGVPVADKLREVSEARSDLYQQAKVDKTPGLTGTQTGNCVAHVIDTQTGEIFESTNGKKGSMLDPDDVHPEIQRRVDELRANGPYPESFDDAGNPVGPNNREYPHFDLPLRHAEVRAANDALHANPDANLDDLIAHPRFLRNDGAKDAPFCMNCSGIFGHDVPSNANRLEYDPQTGRRVERNF